MKVPEILSALPGLSALVVGDICLDRWCTYDPATAEPSRETGIPRIGVVATEVTPGAGARWRTTWPRSAWAAWRFWA